ncbi:MAG: hypothetical protein JSV03_04025, partial [Planctomycetota bacterium]
MIILRRWILVQAILLLLGLVCSAGVLADQVNPVQNDDPSNIADQWRFRLEQALDRWCRWLSGYLYNV